jgi:translocation and assembly module TamB
MAVATDEPVRKSQANRKRWLSRYRWWVLAVVLLLLGAAPRLISKTPLLRWLVDQSTQDLSGRVDYASASFGWFSSGEIHGVKLLDPAKQVIAEAETIQIEKSLWQLLWSRNDFGRIRIVRPKLHLEIENQGSNFERLIAPMLTTASEGPAPVLTLEVMEGEATCKYPSVEQYSTPATVQLDNMSGTVLLGPQQKVQLQGRVWESLEEAKSGSLSLTIELGGEEQPYQLTAELLEVDLGLLNASASRLGLKLSAHGTVSGKLGGWVNDDGSQGELMLDEMSASQVVFQAPDYILDDQPNVKELKALGHLAWNNQRLQFHSLHLESDFASADAKGTIDLNDLNQLWKSNGAEDFEAQGQVNLAVASKQLPSTLKLRHGVTVDEGRIQWLIRSYQQGGQRRLFSNVTTGSIRMMDRGKPVVLNQPLELSAAMIQLSGKPTLEFVSCKSPFLSVNGSGTMAEGKVNVEGSFDELQQYIQQYFALDELTLAGQIEGEVVWSEVPRRSESRPVSAEDMSGQDVLLGGDLVLRNVQCSWGNQPWLVEKELSIAGQTILRSGADYEDLLRQTNLQVLAQDDRFEVKSFTENEASPESVNRPESLPRFVLKGNIQRWANRLGLPLATEGMVVGGEMECSGRLVWQPHSVQVAEGTLTVRDFQIQSEELHLNEPMVVGNCAFGYDWGSNHLVIDLLTLASTSVSLRLDQWVVPVVDSPELLQGQYAVRADLARLGSCFSSMQAMDWKTLGQLEGHGQVSKQRSVANSLPLGFDFTGTIRDFSVVGKHNSSTEAYSDPTSWHWSEPMVSVGVQGTFDFENQYLQIPLGEIKGGRQSLTAQGSLSAEAGDWQIDASGRWRGVDHPWFRLLSPWLGEDAELNGAFDEGFAIKGSLAGLMGDTPNEVSSTAVRTVSWLNESLAGHAGLAWQSGRVLGLPFGTGAIRPSLSQQSVDFGKIHIPLTQGDIRLEPDLLLAGASPTLKLAEGRVLDRVVLTPELSRRWLVYVAPMLAQITQAQGIISLDLQESQFPIEHLEFAEGRGVLEIEQAVIGPGPLAKQVLELVAQVQALVTQQPLQSLSRDSWVELPKQQVQFQIHNGRVYHDQMRIQMGKVVVLTRGSVGQDETIDLVMSIPVQEDWIASRPELAGLRGLTVNMPMSGTLSNPKLDTKALGELSTQLVRQAAGQLIDQQLQRGLQKLFGGGQ